MADADKAPAAPPAPTVTLPLKGYRVVQTQQRSSANEPIDILEIQLDPLSGGNFAWHNWPDAVRLYVERPALEQAKKLLGLK
jgi:hypothetical protein